MNYLKTNHLSLLIIAYLVLAPMFAGSGMLGALDRTTVENPWTFGGTVNVTGVPTFTADAVFNGGVGGIVVTTTNTATSSIIVGCYQFYATSTATAQKFMASTTPGPMYSQYGSCP